MRETLAQGADRTRQPKPTALSSFPPGAPSVTQEGVPFPTVRPFDSGSSLARGRPAPGKASYVAQRILMSPAAIMCSVFAVGAPIFAAI